MQKSILLVLLLALTLVSCKLKEEDLTDPQDDTDIAEITIDFPNGGEELQANSTTNIQWTSTNLKNVKIEYTSNGGANWYTIIQSTESLGFYVWENLPDVSSQQFRIRVSDADDGIPSDVSDENFTVTNQVVEKLTITAPNGGEEWQSGVSQVITWQSSGVDSVKIEYSLNNGATWETIIDSLINSDAYSWNPVPEVDDFKAASIIRISDASDGKPIDESDGTFTIKPVPSINLLEPNGGEEYTAGESVNILWQSVAINNVTIESTPNNGLTWDTLEVNMLNTGKYETGFSIASDEYKIRIRSSTGSPSDVSDGTFTILPKITKVLTVTQPNGGENWLTSDNENTNYHEIQWISENVSNVNVLYSLDGGASWQTIATNIPSNGLYNWAVPKTIQFRTDQARVKIVDAENENLFDLSDGNFSLHPQVKLLRMEQPFGGELYLCPEDDPPLNLVSWTSAGISHVRIEYSNNNGASWRTLRDSYPSTGAYGLSYFDVGVTAGDTLGAATTLARIRVTDVSPGSAVVPPADPNDPVSDISELFNVLICEVGAVKENKPTNDAINRKNK